MVHLYHLTADHRIYNQLMGSLNINYLELHVSNYLISTASTLMV